MTWNLPLFKIYWDEDDVEAVCAAIRSGMNWAVGKNVEEFETEIADFIGTKYCLTFNSGTSALHAGLITHGIGRGDEVIVPSFTFIATANAPLFVGARPVFADIEETTLGLDPDSVVNRITSKTKAIIPIHFGGCPCQIRELREIADDHDLVLIEDAAEAFGASIDGAKVGTYGDSAMLSFCQNKIITTGEGGALVSDSRDVYEKGKLIRSHGRLETVDYFTTHEKMDYISIGYNFRLSNISAALGVSQLQKVDSIIEMRKAVADMYINLFEKKEHRVSTLKTPKGYKNVYQLFSIHATHRDGLMKYLAEKGIMSKIYFDPVHMTSYYRQGLGYNISLPVTEKVANDILSLPIYPGMANGDVEKVVQAIGDFYSVK